MCLSFIHSTEYLFLPLSLEEISKSKNFTYKGKNLKTAYLIDIIHNLILKYYFKKENKFNLMASILKEKYGHLYNYYMNFLINNGVLVLLDSTNENDVPLCK